jgi:membrane protease YdiL (CAAX protease family)
MHKTLASAVVPHRTAHRRLIARWPLAAFFALAFGLTWSFLIADALGQRGLIPFRLTLSGPGLALTLLMSYGPTLAALFVAGVSEGWAGTWSLLRAATRWRVGLRWYILALGGPAALFYVAARLSELLGGEPRPLPAQGWTVLLAGVVGSVVHGVANGEEVGWRGYALPQLLRHQRGLTASLMLGAIWFVFHIPIMFVPNSIAGGQSFETALPFLVSVLATSTLMTWVYRSTGGSVLLTILLHGAANVWPSLVGGTASEVTLAWVQAVLLGLVASAVVVRYGPELGPPTSDGV